MPHLNHELISAYVDGQLDPAETRNVELHLNECGGCCAVLAEMQELTDLFKDAEQFEPSPFLWTRIAAGFEQEKPSIPGRFAAAMANLRRLAFRPGLAAGCFALLMIAGIAVYREVNPSVTDRAALAEIDKAYQILAVQYPDSYNPFVSASSPDLEANPFRSMRLRGGNGSDPEDIRH